MGHGKVGDKSLAQKTDFSIRNRDVLCGQFLYNILFATTVNKESISHVNNDIIAERAPVRNKGLQGLTGINPSVFLSD